MIHEYLFYFLLFWVAILISNSIKLLAGMTYIWAAIAHHRRKHGTGWKDGFDPDRYSAYMEANAKVVSIVTSEWLLSIVFTISLFLILYFTR